MTTNLELARSAGEATQLVVSGEIDLSNIGAFRAALSEGGDSPLVVDLTGVTYLDSAGIAALFERARRSDLEIVLGPSSVLAPLIEITHLAEVAKVRLC